MKKLFLLISCSAVILVLSKMSFAAEEVVTEPAAPCTCTASQFVYLPATHKNTRLAALVSKRALAAQEPAEQNRREARKAARAAAPVFQPVPQEEVDAVQVAKLKAPVINFMSLVGPQPRYPVAEGTGYAKVPVINFMSIVRGQRQPAMPPCTCGAVEAE